MNSWRPYPFVRLTLPLTAGIVTGLATKTTQEIPWAGISGMLMLILASRILPLIFSHYSYRWLPGIVINLYFLAAGFILTHVSRSGYSPDYLTKDSRGFFLAQIKEPPSENPSGYKTVIELKAVCKSEQWHSVSGEVLAWLKPRHGDPIPQFGDMIWLARAPDSVMDNSNPFSFNYAEYLKRKGIVYKVRAAGWEWKPLSGQKRFGLLRFAYEIRQKLLIILKQNNLSGDEYAVAAALLLGYVGDVSPELMRGYSASGAMHVLSVSGMHVGIIYLFLEFILSFLNRNKWGKIFKVVLILLLIWFYAMMTGLAPCIARAAVMITLPIIARSMNRVPDMINVIASTFFIMIAYDPLVLYDIGFQLSFLAVTGLVILYKPIYDLYITSKWLPDKIWSLWAVSIAAQIATLPVTLYVFHQFPNYFLLTNLLVVPVSSLVIYTGIIVLAFSPWAWLSMLLAKALIFLIWLLNSMILFIERLPLSTTNGLFISFPSVILMFGLIIMLMLFWFTKKTIYIHLTLVTLILMTGNALVNDIKRQRQCGISVFNVRDELLIRFYQGTRAVTVYGNGNSGDFSILSNQQKLLNDHQDGLGIKMDRKMWGGCALQSLTIKNGFIPLSGRHGSFIFNGTRFYILKTKIPKHLRISHPGDIVIITGSPSLKMADVQRIFSPETVVLDGTNSYFRRQRWIREGDSLGMKIHSVAERGAFQFEFNLVYPLP
jgi:competence protein ComEC